MMSPEKAIRVGMRRCGDLAGKIRCIEEQTQRMNARDRAEFGAWRALMFAAGVYEDELPEPPYLNPEHIKNYEEHKRARAEVAA